MKTLTYKMIAIISFLFMCSCSETSFDQSEAPAQKLNTEFNDVDDKEIKEIPEVNTEDCETSKVCFVIRDNFERDNILDGEFSWNEFLDDLGRGLSGLDISIKDQGESSQGESAAFFTGRTGGSVHSLFLISKSFDLTGFNKLTIEFDYLLASFEDVNYGGIVGNEFLKVDLCSGTSEYCGVVSNRSKARERLNDSNLWENLFTAEADTPTNQDLNGFNHSADDFIKVRGNQIEIDLNNPNIDKSNVILRWNVLIDEGLDSPESPDAGIIDNILVRAYK